MFSTLGNPPFGFKYITLQYRIIYYFAITVNKNFLFFSLKFSLNSKINVKPTTYSINPDFKYYLYDLKNK